MVRPPRCRASKKQNIKISRWILTHEPCMIWFSRLAFTHHFSCLQLLSHSFSSSPSVLNQWSIRLQGVRATEKPPTLDTNLPVTHPQSILFHCSCTETSYLDQISVFEEVSLAGKNKNSMTTTQSHYCSCVLPQPDTSQSWGHDDYLLLLSWGG